MGSGRTGSTREAPARELAGDVASRVPARVDAEADEADAGVAAGGAEADKSAGPSRSSPVLVRAGGDEMPNLAPTAAYKIRARTCVHREGGDGVRGGVETRRCGSGEGAAVAMV